MTRAILPFAVLLVACGPSAAPNPATAPTKSSSTGAVERYFPLEEGRLYNYVTRENGDTGMLVAKVKRADASHGELRLSNKSDRYVYSPEGVAHDGGAFVLKEPIVVGTTWVGEHGGTTRIESVDANVKVQAGSYASCVRTVEEGGRLPGARYVSTFCPGVGLVLLEAIAPGGEAKIELKSYGLPVKID